MNLRKIDLNLLVILHQLLQDQHVSKAAAALNMSQPAVSRALQRLRKLFDDSLLVRTSNGYELSSRAESLYPQLKQLLKNTEELISGPVFDPATSTQTIRFYGPDPEISRSLIPLFKRMRNQAPNMKLIARSDPRDHFLLLDRGEVHFVFSAFEPAANTAQLRRMKLAPIELAIVMSANHPLANGRLTLNKYLKSSHGMVSLTGQGNALVEKNLIRQGHLKSGEHLDIPLTLGSFSAIASFCEQTDILFHLPKQFAEELARGRNLIVKDTLPDLKSKYEYVYLYWHERFHKDPMCYWVRAQMKAIYNS